VISQLTPPAGSPTIDFVRAVTDLSPPRSVDVSADVSALVERARRQDPAAFRELFQRHVRAIHRVATRIYGPSPDVDDIVQTAFVEAFRSLGDFRGDALFSTWLTRIAVRVALRAARKRSVRAIPLDQALERAADTPGPERIAAAREGLLVLERLLDELRPKRRAAFVLNVLEGYSMDEVAAILGASTTAVKVRVHDARRQFERRLKHHPELLSALTGQGVES
jgi:RNA polymerase sigma-70 factor, ECF subfamily